MPQAIFFVLIQEAFVYAGIFKSFQNQRARFVARICLVLNIVPTVRIIAVLALGLLYFEICSQQNALRYVLSVVEKVEQAHHIVSALYKLAGNVNVGLHAVAYLLLPFKYPDVLHKLP